MKKIFFALILVLIFGGGIFYYFYYPKMAVRNFPQLVKRGKFKEAEKAIRYISSPKDGDTLYQIALVYFNLKDLDKAETFIKEALIVRPEEPVFLNFYGNVLREKKEYNKAKDYYQKAREINPDFPEVKANLQLLEKLSLE